MALGLLVSIPLEDAIGAHPTVLDVLLVIGGSIAIALAWVPEVFGRSFVVGAPGIELPSGERIATTAVRIIPYSVKRYSPRNLDGVVVSAAGRPPAIVPLMLTRARTEVVLAQLTQVLGRERVEAEPRWVGRTRLARRGSMLLAQGLVLAAICGSGAGYLSDILSIDNAFRLSIISLIIYVAFVFRALRLETGRVSARAVTATS